MSDTEHHEFREQVRHNAEQKVTAARRAKDDAVQAVIDGYQNNTTSDEQLWELVYDLNRADQALTQAIKEREALDEK